MEVKKIDSILMSVYNKEYSASKKRVVLTLPIKLDPYGSENGYLILEIGYDQKEDVENLLKENKNYSEIKTIQDLSGNDRCVIAKVGKI